MANGRVLPRRKGETSPVTQGNFYSGPVLFLFLESLEVLGKFLAGIPCCRGGRFRTRTGPAAVGQMGLFPMRGSLEKV